MKKHRSKPEFETINHCRRPVGHISDLIIQLERWLKIREHLPPKIYAKYTKLIHMAIAYLIEYRDIVYEFPQPRVEVLPVKVVYVYDYETRKSRRVYAKPE